jgi:hypothetical protein
MATHNWIAVVDPTVNDDITARYTPGSNWLNTVTGDLFWCVDPAAGAAVWLSASVAARSRTYPFNAASRVPVGGTLFLDYGQVPTSATPVGIRLACQLVGGIINVNVADASNDYDCEILINGGVVETIALASGNVEATAPFSASIIALDDMSARLVRTAGAGQSDFEHITLTVEAA